MDKATVQKMIDDAIAAEKRDAQYSTNRTPTHQHNGQDSNRINYPDLLGASEIALTASVVLTVAQIKALHTTPIELIPKVASSLIIIEGITARIPFNTTAYTGANNLEFRYTDGSGTKVTADMTNTFLNSASSAFDYAPAVATELTPIAGGTGSNGRVVVAVPTANPATGDSPLYLEVKYRVVTFPI